MAILATFCGVAEWGFSAGGVFRSLLACFNPPVHSVTIIHERTSYPDAAHHVSVNCYGC